MRRLMDFLFALSIRRAQANVCFALSAIRPSLDVVSNAGCRRLYALGGAAAFICLLAT